MSYELKHGLKSLFSGVMIGYAITALVFITYAILLTYTNLTEDNISTVITITTIISVLVAGFDAARGRAKRGWLWGIAAGFMYSLLLIVVLGFLVGEIPMTARITTILTLSLAGGGLGGVFGINMKKKR